MSVRTALLALSLTLALASPVSQAANPLGRYADEMPLSGDLAFRTSMMTARDGAVLVRWEMPAGYYLYRDKLTVKGTNGLEVTRVVSPSGEIKDDPFLGPVEIYRDAVTVRVARKPGVAGTLVVRYQGCAEDKVCYPPMTRAFTVPAGSACNRGGQGAGQQSAC